MAEAHLKEWCLVRYRHLFLQSSHNANQCISQGALDRTARCCLLLSVEHGWIFSMRKCPFSKLYILLHFPPTEIMPKVFKKRAGTLLSINNFVFLEVKNSKTPNGREFRQIHCYSHEMLSHCFLLQNFYFVFLTSPPAGTLAGSRQSDSSV